MLKFIPSVQPTLTANDADSLGTLKKGTTYTSSPYVKYKNNSTTPSRVCQGVRVILFIIVENEIFYKFIREKLNDIKCKNKILLIKIPRGALSKAIGQKKKNKLRLISEYELKDIIFIEDDNLTGYNAVCEERKN